MGDNRTSCDDEEIEMYRLTTAIIERGILPPALVDKLGIPPGKELTMSDDDPDHLPACSAHQHQHGCCAPGCPIATAERRLDEVRVRLDRERERKQHTPTAELEASRFAARLRVRAAMQHIEAAQYELAHATADLCSVHGFAPEWTAVGKLGDRVHSMWYKVERKWQSSARAPFVGDSPMATLDSIGAPDGVIGPREHAHSGCGDRTGGVRFYGLLGSTMVGLVVALLIALFAGVGCGAGTDASTCDASLPACAEVGCPDAALCTSAGVCSCTVDGEVVSCQRSSSDAGVDAPDAGVDALDAPDANALDAASGGLPLNAPCEPLLDQCAAGLTCRIRAAHDGLCRPVGLLAEGATCMSLDQCGPNMGCVSAGQGQLWCQIVCDVAQPEPRCGVGDRCRAFWGPDTGLCDP